MARVPAAKNLNEFDLIARHFAPLSMTEPGALGLKDDAAVLTPEPGHDCVVTMDTLIEGVHFLPDSNPRDLAWKLLAVNLSDLASMGARPRAYTLSLAIPKSIDEAWLADFSAGLSDMQKAHDITLIGGDTVSSPTLVLTLTALGCTPTNTVLTRCAAQEGDIIYVSGTIGGGALGLLQAQDKRPGDDLIHRYTRPTPRVLLGQDLLGRARACADISDGLLADLGHICEQSKVRAVIEAEKVPTEGSPDDFVLAVTGGDDYELVFTAPASEDLSDLPVTAIGRLEAGEGVSVLAADGSEMTFTHNGYQHFAN